MHESRILLLMRSVRPIVGDNFAGEWKNAWKIVRAEMETKETKSNLFNGMNQMNK